MDEIKLMIVGIALQNTQVVSPTQKHVVGSSNGILGPGWSSYSTSHYTKLEFPQFSGEGLNGWLYKVEQFFEIDHTLEPNKVKLASISLGGKALHWYKEFLKPKESGRVFHQGEFVEAVSTKFGE